MKILVDREKIQTIYNMMEDPCEGTVCVEIRKLVKDILDNSMERPDMKKLLVDKKIIESLVDEITFNQASGITKTRLGLETILESHARLTDAVIVERDRLNEIFNIVNDVKDGFLEGLDEKALQTACDMLKKLILSDKRIEEKDSHFYGDKGVEKPLSPSIPSEDNSNFSIKELILRISDMEPRLAMQEITMNKILEMLIKCGETKTIAQAELCKIAGQLKAELRIG